MRYRQTRLATKVFAAMVALSLGGGIVDVLAKDVSADRPNFVVMVADDWSWPHASVLGDPVVQTPHFDRVADEGVLFDNAFVSTPSCTPSRLSILTGQHHWRLQEGDSLGGSLREGVPVYTEMLRDAGYHLGRFGKGVWPSKHTFRKRDSFGPRYRSFENFLASRKEQQPFCYWHGGQDPHRPYQLNVGQDSGMNLADVIVPKCLPDNEIVRGDVADYLWEVQRFDREVGEVIAHLESIGELDQTILIVTSDNGMPFPRCKATLYDQGTRVPFAIRWGSKIEGGRRISDMVTLCDLSPTILEFAGLRPPAVTTGKSLRPLLESKKSGQIDSARTFALAGMERHVYSYPCRSLRTKEFLYVRNFDPESWPTGEVDGHNPTYDFAAHPWPTEPGAFSFNIDPSPSKQLLRLNRNQDGQDRFASLAFDYRPAEELYDLAKDPHQLTNVADDPTFRSSLRTLRQKLTSELIKSGDPRIRVDGYQDRRLEGWAVRVSDKLLAEQSGQTQDALKLLRQQLRQVVDRVPAAVVAHLQDVPIWVSPEYSGVRPTAEYHPDVNWLRSAGRHAELVKCVELTNVAIFAKECDRMPMMMLHELAHAYHDRVLGFDHPGIKANFERVQESGIYNAVMRSNGKLEQAYAMSNRKEYFAETSEAFFGTNDFYPFNRNELRRHDPSMYELLSELWQTQKSPAKQHSRRLYKVTSPPKEMNLDDFYGKYVSASGYPIVSSSRVNDYALKEAAYLVDLMLGKRPDLRRAMIASGSRMIVMAHDEFTTDVPEHSHLTPGDYMDARARGLGGSRTDPVCSVAEENLLGFKGDPYASENILIHEFAHNIHLRGMVNLDPTFDDRLKATYERSMNQNRWTGKYASTNHAEYFAEGVQSWFNNNREPDHDHNFVNTRTELRDYDPELAALCEEVFGTTELVYTRPETRLEGHLAGYQPSQSPEFRWPDHLIKVQQKIRQEAKSRGKDRRDEYKN
mgnify:CR=1 FL=1|tara:strand:+ start:41553 stop:44468 length:2916 start_codon:yes stop_codon:yes gene_type:complete